MKRSLTGSSHLSESISGFSILQWVVRPKFFCTELVKVHSTVQILLTYLTEHWIKTDHKKATMQNPNHILYIKHSSKVIGGKLFTKSDEMINYGLFKEDSILKINLGNAPSPHNLMLGFTLNVWSELMQVTAL